MDEKVGGLLVATDLTKSDSAGPVAVQSFIQNQHDSVYYFVRLLDSSGCRRALSGGLGGELLTRGFASGGLAGGLLGSGHLGVLDLLEFFFGYM